MRQQLIQEERAPTLQDATSGYPYTRALAHVISVPNPSALDYSCSEKAKLANVGSHPISSLPQQTQSALVPTEGQPLCRSVGMHLAAGENGAGIAWLDPSKLVSPKLSMPTVASS